MDTPTTHQAEASIHARELHRELQKLRLSVQIHVAVNDDLKRVNLRHQTEIQRKDQELQLYYQHINKLVHNLNHTNFTLTHTQRELIESRHVSTESLRLMEEYKRQCEMLTEQLKHSENQKAEQEKVIRTMYEVMENAKGFIDPPSSQPHGSFTGSLGTPVAKRNYYDATPVDFNPKGGPISATRGGQEVDTAFDRFMRPEHTSMVTGPFPAPVPEIQHGLSTKLQARPAITGGPISATRGGQDINSAFGRFMQQLGKAEASTATSSLTSTPGTARLNPASAPFTPSTAGSQHPSQDVLPPAQPIFVRPATKSVTVTPPGPKPSSANLSETQSIQGRLGATTFGDPVASVDTSQSLPKREYTPAMVHSSPGHEARATKNAVSDEPRVKGTQAPVSHASNITALDQPKKLSDPSPPQEQGATPEALRAWFDQLKKKSSITPSATQSSAEPGQLIDFSDPGSPENLIGGSKKNAVTKEKKTQHPPIISRNAPKGEPMVASARDVFAQMPPDVRAAIQRVQKMASSSQRAEPRQAQVETITAPTLITAQREDKDMTAALGELQANWSKAKPSNSSSTRENVPLTLSPTTPGMEKEELAKANNNTTPKAFQEIREPAPLVPYPSSEDSFDTRGSSKISSSDNESHNSIEDPFSRPKPKNGKGTSSKASRKTLGPPTDDRPAPRAAASGLLESTSTAVNFQTKMSQDPKAFVLQSASQFSSFPSNWKLGSSDNGNRAQAPTRETKGGDSKQFDSGHSAMELGRGLFAFGSRSTETSIPQSGLDTVYGSETKLEDSQESRSIGGSHVLGHYLDSDVKAMVLRGRQTSIEAPNDLLTAAQLGFKKMDRFGNKWQKIDHISDDGRHMSGWVILSFRDPAAFDRYRKA